MCSWRETVIFDVMDSPHPPQPETNARTRMALHIILQTSVYLAGAILEKVS